MTKSQEQMNSWTTCTVQAYLITSSDILSGSTFKIKGREKIRLLIQNRLSELSQYLRISNIEGEIKKKKREKKIFSNDWTCLQYPGHQSRHKNFWYIISAMQPQTWLHIWVGAAFVSILITPVVIHSWYRCLPELKSGCYFKKSQADGKWMNRSSCLFLERHL